MSITIIQEKLQSYHCQTVLEQYNALKEIMQDIALMALSRTGFFRLAGFQGGTCLRILYGLERFSEDLDFILEEPNKNFTWEEYIHTMTDEFNAYGFSLEVKDRANLEGPVKTAFLKADSEGGILIIKDLRTNKPKLKIKLEIDTNPPQGSNFELKYLDFPLAYSVKTQDLPSLFAGKCHALLCRKYIKGRDWYDFTWYVSKQIPINFVLLSNAINQQGPWQGQNIAVDKDWFLEELKVKIETMNWEEVKQDVAPFLRAREQSTLNLWSSNFFLSRVKKLQDLLSKS